MNRIKKLMIITAANMVLWVALSLPAFAAGDEIVIPGADIGLGSFTLPTFISLDIARNFSIFSWIGLAVSIFFFVILMIWVVIIIRAAVDIVRSQGNEDMIKGSYKRFGSVFWSITFLIGFVAVLSIVASFFGLGAFWDWPKVFSQCDKNVASGEIVYYYQRALETQTTGEDADNACFQ